MAEGETKFMRNYASYQSSSFSFGFSLFTRGGIYNEHKVTDVKLANKRKKKRCNTSNNFQRFHPFRPSFNINMKENQLFLANPTHVRISSMPHLRQVTIKACRYPKE